MMHAHLLEMDAILSAPGFFDFLADLDCDRALDSRDAEPFDAQWMASFDEIDGDPGAVLDRPAVDALRKRRSRSRSARRGMPAWRRACPTTSS